MNATRPTTIRLTTENVEAILNRCLYVPNSRNGCNPVNIEGYKNNYAFNTQALLEEEANIAALLEQLPRNFKDGWSFWEMYRTEDGRNWTTSLKPMEDLMVLGIATKKIRYILPRESWWSLPGGAPYVVVNT